MERRVAVDVIAWIFIGLASLGILAGSLQWFLMPPLQLPAHQGIGLSGYTNVITIAKLVVMSVLLAASAGLLYRRNPARIVFIAITFFCIAWNVVDLVLRAWCSVSVSLLPVRVNHAHIPASFCLLSAWAIWMLTRPSVRAGFVSPRRRRARETTTAGND